jgi:hypothetical protein
MDRCDEDLLDRAYQRRFELLSQPGLRWVRMHLERSGVTLVCESADGGIRTEFLERRVDPADGDAANGGYDRD